jgi:hypothetical protein
VKVTPGDYGEQWLNPAPKGSLRPVVFEAVAGTQPQADEVDVKASHVEFRGMRFGWKAEPGADDVTFRNVSSRSLFIWSATHIRVIGGELYPGEDYLTGCTQEHNTCDYDSQLTSAYPDGAPPEHILFDRVHFHGWLRPAGTDFHTECLQVGSGIDVTIERSRFDNCATHDIFIRSWGTAFTLRDWKIENNYFGPTQDGYFVMQVVEGSDPALPCENFLIRNNSALQDMNMNCKAGGDRGVRVESNIWPTMGSYMCDLDGSAWDYNVYGSGTPCGRHDRIGRIGFVDPAGLDLRLTRGSVAIKAGNPRSFPPTDIAGHRRRKGRRPDAGASVFP